MLARNRRFSRLAILLAISVSQSACGDPPPAPDLVRPVRAAKVGDVSGLDGRSFPGKAEPTEEVVLSFRVGGPLTERPVDVGAVVQKGDLIARIDPRDYEVALESAQARLASAQAELKKFRAGARPETIRALENSVRAAKADLENARIEEQRYKKLWEGGTESKSVYDTHKLRMDVAQETLDAANEKLDEAQVARPEVIEAQLAEVRSLRATVAQAQDQLRYTELRAPYDGEISGMFVENFQTMNAKQPVCRLLDTSRIEFTIQVPEVLIALAPQVRDLRVSFDAFPGLSLPAEIKHIRSEATQQTRTYPVTLILDQPEGRRVLPGMAGSASGKADAVDSSEGLQIPVTAVFADESGNQFVWIIDAGTNVVEKRKVTSLGMTSTGIRVDGLAVGEWIAIAGTHTLEAGWTVRIVDATTDEEQP